VTKQMNWKSIELCYKYSRYRLWGSETASIDRQNRLEKGYGYWLCR
jgi:hypothetical protein